MSPYHTNAKDVIFEVHDKHYLYVLFVKTIGDKYIRVASSTLQELLDIINKPVSEESSLVEGELRISILAGSDSILVRYKLPKHGIQNHSMEIVKVDTVVKVKDCDNTYDVKFNVTENDIELYVEEEGIILS